MLLVRRILIWTVVLALVPFAAGYAYVLSRGKTIVEQRLSLAFHRPVTIREIHLTLPPRLQVEGLTMEGLLQVEQAYMNIGLLFSRSPVLILSSVYLYQPQIDLTGIAAIPLMAASPGESDPQLPAVRSVKEGGWGVMIEDIQVKGGTIRYERQLEQGPRKIILSDLDLTAENLPYPLVPQQTGFELRGRFQYEGFPLEANHIFAKGTANLADKDMDAQVTVTQDDGRTGLTAELKSVKNDLRVQGRVNLALISIKADPAAQKVTVADILSEALKSSGKEYLVQFSFQTRMNDFQVDQVKFSGDIDFKDFMPGSPK